MDLLQVLVQSLIQRVTRSQGSPECGPVPELGRPRPEPDPERGSDLEIEPPVRLGTEPEIELEDT